MFHAKASVRNNSLRLQVLGNRCMEHFFNSSKGNLQMRNKNNCPGKNQYSVQNQSNILHGRNNISGGNASSRCHVNGSHINHGNQNQIQKSCTDRSHGSSQHIGMNNVLCHLFRSLCNASMFIALFIKSTNNPKSRQSFSYQFILYINILVRIFPQASHISGNQRNKNQYNRGYH